MTTLFTIITVSQSRLCYCEVFLPTLRSDSSFQSQEFDSRSRPPNLDRLVLFQQLILADFLPPSPRSFITMSLFFGPRSGTHHCPTRCGGSRTLESDPEPLGSWQSRTSFRHHRKATTRSPLALHRSRQRFVFLFVVSLQLTVHSAQVNCTSAKKLPGKHSNQRARSLQAKKGSQGKEVNHKTEKKVQQKSSTQRLKANLLSPASDLFLVLIIPKAVVLVGPPSLSRWRSSFSMYVT